MKKLLVCSLALIVQLQLIPAAAEKSTNQFSVKQKIVYVGLTPKDQPGFWVGGTTDPDTQEIETGMEEFARITVANAMTFWSENSNGNLKFSTPQFFFAKAGTALKHCNPNADIKSGMKIAGLKKIPLGTRLVVANINDSCGYGGLGQQGGNTLNLKSIASTTLIHELGHNFGFRHSSAMYCKKSDYSKFNSTNCVVDEYGDFRDVMGNDEWCPGTTLSATQRATIFGVPAAKNIQIGVELTVDQSQNKTGIIVYRFKHNNNWYFFEYFNPGKDKCMLVTNLAYGPQLEVRIIGPKWISSAGKAIGPTLVTREDIDLPEPGVSFERDGVPIMKPYGGWTLSGLAKGESMQLPGAPFLLTVKSTDATSAIFVLTKNG